MLEPEVETRPWAEQLALDDASYRTQVAYLLERSSFYRRSSPASTRRAGSPRSHSCRSTEKDELRATRTPENPFGTHLCADPPSSSGSTRRAAPRGRRATSRSRHATSTTGSPAPRAATPRRGSAAGQRIVSTYNAGPFVAGAALASFDRIGLAHIPVGTGNTDRLVRAIEELRPEAAVLTPSYAAYLAESHDLRSSSVERVLVAGEPGGGEPAFRARLEEGWGARVTEAMGIGDIGISLWGECEAQDGMHLGARGFVHAELIDPDTGRRTRAGGRRDGRAGADTSPTPRGAAAALPHARPCRGADEPVLVRPHGPARALHRPDRRHADRPRRQRLPGRDPRGRERVRAGRERADPRPAGGGRREAGTAAPRQRRACAETPPPPRWRRRSPTGSARRSSCERRSSWCPPGAWSGASTSRSSWSARERHRHDGGRQLPAARLADRPRAARRAAAAARARARALARGRAAPRAGAGRRDAARGRATWSGPGWT